MSLEGIHLSLDNGSLTWLKGEAEAFTLFIALFIILYSAVSGDIFPYEKGDNFKFLGLFYCVMMPFPEMKTLSGLVAG